MSNVAFDVTRDYQIAQDTTGLQYLVQDGNWYAKPTQVPSIIVPNGYKFLPKGVSPTYPGQVPIVLLQSAIPVIKPSSGTLTAGGALSAIVALNATYTNGCWVFLPAGTTDPADPVGLYFAKMSSTSAGTLFRNQLTSGAPFIPAASALIPCTAAASYTQSTALDTVLTIPIPASSSGPNGLIDVYTNAANDLAAGTKNGAVNLNGGMSMATFSQTTVNIYTPSWRKIGFRGVTGVEVGGSGTGIVAAAGAPVAGAQDGTAALNLTFQLQIQNAATNTCQYDLIHSLLWPG